MVKAMSATESLLFVVGQLFGTSKPEGKDLDTVSDMESFVRSING